MNNKTLVIIGVGIAAGLVIGYLIGSSRQTVVTVERVVAAKPDSLWKRVLLAVSYGLARGFGGAIGSKMLGAPMAQSIHA